MTERLGGGWLRSSTVWTKEQMHRRKDTSPMSGPEKKKNRQALMGNTGLCQINTETMYSV